MCRTNPLPELWRCIRSVSGSCIERCSSGNVCSTAPSSSASGSGAHPNRIYIMASYKRSKSLYAPNLDSLKGYLNSSSFLNHTCFFFLVTTCSAQTCFAFSFMNFRIYRGSHNSLATPRSLQQRIRAFDLHPSVAVGMPSGEK